MEKKANHQVNVVRIETILPHTNADKLEIIQIEGYQCVVGKGQFKPGDLAIYIQPDSVVPQTEPFRFIWEPYAGDPTGTFPEGTQFPVPERRRRITVKKLRGEYSEGLLLPVSDFGKAVDQHAEINGTIVDVGDDVSDLIGVSHYDPDKGREHTTACEVISGPRRRYPRTLKGWFFFLLHKLGFRSAGRQLNEEVSFDLPIYDVDAYKKHTRAFQPGEPVVVTEKIHGSNARYVFLDGKMYAGSHNFWKALTSNCVWRKALAQNPWIEEWCRAHEGYALYGEVTPTQKGFDYGCDKGQVKFFVFDIRTPDGKWLDWIPSFMLPQLNIVPVLYTGPFDLEKIKTVVDGPSLVDDAKHIREGAVVKPAKGRHVPGLGRLILKIVSNAFLDKDGKASAAAA